MFATHYHELSALEDALPGVRNYNITAKKRGGDLIFLRKIVRGAADDSYGIEVAKLAGVPDAVITRAKTCLRELEEKQPTVVRTAKPAEDEGQISFTDVGSDEIKRLVREASLDTMTPIEAMNFLYELKKKVNA